MQDWFKVGTAALGPWSVERETLVIRYCDCNFKCPICYAAGPSYIHRLQKSKYPNSSTIGSGSITRIIYNNNYLNYVGRNILDKLRAKAYIRIQGGEPIFKSSLNKDRPKLTAHLAIDSLKMGKKSGADRFVCVIQTNGYYLGLREKHAREFIDDVIEIAKEKKLLDELKKEDRYRIAIEISYKAPNDSDFKIFSGRPKFDFKKQINAYWNLVRVVQDYNLDGMAIYPIAGFVMPLKNTCGIVPVGRNNLPLFHRNTWDADFERVIDDYWNSLRDKNQRRYDNFRRYVYNKFGKLELIRGEELEITGFQRHVPFVYSKFQEFRDHFDKFKQCFKLCPGCSKNRIYQQYVDIGLEQLSMDTCNAWRNNLDGYIFSDLSKKYYPNL